MKHEHDLECKDLLGNLSEFIDGELDAETCQKLKEHMAGCETCRVVYDTTTRTIYLCQTSINEAELPAGVRSRLFKTLRLEDLLAPGEV
jgi:anti-sigma factor (TIGR02949 family)